MPGQIYMGLALDGFIQLNPDGSGTPWGIPGATPEEVKRDIPWRQIAWPALSGKGMRPIAASVSIASCGDKAINWFDPARASHVRNAVNDAYRDTLLPQPPLATAADAECIIETRSGATVWSVSKAGERQGVIADRNGKAWFQFDAPGVYRFSAGEREAEFEVPSRAPYAARPGFDKVAHFNLK